MADFLPSLKISDYTYDLPADRIAEFPPEVRGNSKLLLADSKGLSVHRFSEIPDLLNKSFLVFNDTKVIPARLLFIDELNHPIEIFLLNPLKDDWSLWEVMVGNRRKFRDDQILLSDAYQGLSGSNHLQVKWSNRDLNQIMLSVEGRMTVKELINLHGNVPLPPYIKRAPESLDKERYQTVFGKYAGAVAAPTASLHFTDAILEDIRKKDSEYDFLTLHVGLGTFKPVTAEFTTGHDMHTERFVISAGLVRQIMDRIDSERIAVGTTSLRVLESLYYIGAGLVLNRANPHIIERDAGFDPELNAIDFGEAMNVLLQFLEKSGQPMEGETAIFIIPGFKFKIADALITNFHQPNSTLLMLVAAFFGEDWRKIYEFALANEFQFLSYGDSSLLRRQGKEK